MKLEKVLYEIEKKVVGIRILYPFYNDWRGEDDVRIMDFEITRYYKKDQWKVTTIYNIPNSDIATKLKSIDEDGHEITELIDISDTDIGKQVIELVKDLF